MFMLRQGKKLMKILSSVEKELNGVIVKGSRKLVTSTSGLPPPIYSLPKDLMAVDDGQEHPLRSKYHANAGPGSRISNILALIIDAIKTVEWCFN